MQHGAWDLLAFCATSICADCPATQQNIICYARETWDCPIIFYIGTKYDSEQYAQMVELLYAMQDKWNIGIIDLWNSEEMNAVSKDDYDFYMADPIHSTQAG